MHTCMHAFIHSASTYLLCVYCVGHSELVCILLNNIDNYDHDLFSNQLYIFKNFKPIQVERKAQQMSTPPDHEILFM